MISAQRINEIQKYDRKDSNRQVINAGYDMKMTALKLQKYYLE